MPGIPHPGQERAYLGIGSNLGDRLTILQKAVDFLARSPDITVVAVSPVYETDPVGGPEQGPYLNAVVAVETTLDPYSLLKRGLILEGLQRRVRKERWGPRTLDVDVLLYGDLTVDEPHLQVPHPRMYERGFVMAPLADLDPGMAMEAPPGGWKGVRRTDLSLQVP